MFYVEIVAPDGKRQRELRRAGPITIVGVKIELRRMYVEVEGVRGQQPLPWQFERDGHRITILDVTPPLFEASYHPISAEESALVDAIVTGDVASRMIYADWLEERGDAERADIVRRLAEGGEVDRDMQLALAPTNVRWRARVLEPAIEGCELAECPRHWGALERSGRADVRRCTRCTKLVLYCVTEAQAAEHRENKGAVVFDPFADRTKQLSRARGV